MPRMKYERMNTRPEFLQRINDAKEKEKQEKVEKTYEVEQFNSTTLKYTFEATSDFGQIQIFDPGVDIEDGSEIEGDTKDYAWKLPDGWGIALGVIETGVHNMSMLISREDPLVITSRWDHVVEIPFKSTSKKIEIEGFEFRLPAKNVLIRWCIKKGDGGSEDKYQIDIWSAREKETRVVKRANWD